MFEVLRRGCKPDFYGGGDVFKVIDVPVWASCFFQVVAKASLESSWSESTTGIGIESRLKQALTETADGDAALPVELQPENVAAGFGGNVLHVFRVSEIGE